MRKHTRALLQALGNCKRKVKEELGHPKNGMVMDFGDLKKVVKPNIVDKFDHALVLNANSPHADINLEAFDKVYHLDYQPTSENLVIDFANYIKAQLPEWCEFSKSCFIRNCN